MGESLSGEKNMVVRTALWELGKKCFYILSLLLRVLGDSKRWGILLKL